MHRKGLIQFMLLMLLTFLLTACGTGNEGNGQGAQDAPPENNGEKEANYIKNLQLGTGSTGGTYFPLGQEIASVVKNNVAIEGFDMSAVSTGSSVDNLARIGREELQLGMSVHIPAQNAKNGQGEFDGMPITNFGFMGHIYPEVMQIVTLGSTGINTIEDLKGKKVAIGPPGSGTQAAAKAILSAHGINDGDYQAFEEGFGDAKNKLQDGQLDASFAFLGLPASSINELYAQTKDVKFLEVKGDALNKLLETTGYEAFEIEAGKYEWLGTPVSAVTAYAILVGSTSQISEELGYEITKALFENANKITHEQGKYITKEDALQGSKGLDFHPGTERYFKEIGILK